MIYNWLNPDIMDKIYCYSKYESSANGDWIHFVDNSKRKTVLTINIGKIFPLIPICWDSFKALTDNRYYVDNSWYALLSKKKYIHVLLLTKSMISLKIWPNKITD